MMQALPTILSDGPNSQKRATKEVSFLYGSRSRDDILGGEMLDKCAEQHCGKFKHVNALSHETEESNWAG